MSTIRYRKDNRFELRFYFDSKQYSVYSKDRSKLVKKRDEKIKALKKEQKEKKNKTTNCIYKLKTWADFWFDNYKKPFVAEQTGREIQSLLKNYIVKNFGNYNLDEITINNLQPYLNKLPKTRTKELIITYFNACLQKAEDLEFIKKNPFKLVVKDKKIKNVRKAFTIEEQEKLLSKIKQTNYEHYKLILFYLATGVRRSEALTLTSKDFKNNNVIHIKGTKTDNADRFIRITENLKNLIYKEGKIFNYNGSYVTHMFKDYLAELNITGTLHCLRHSYATNQYYLGTPAKQVQMNMGHSEIGITMDIYTNIVVYEDKTKILEKIKKLYNDYYIELQN